MVGANVEGGLFGERYSDVESLNVIEIGGVSAAEYQKRNCLLIPKMLKDKSVDNHNALKKGINFTDKEIKYYKNDVEIGGEISGLGTIIIEDANLIIKNDLTYADNNSSLGVILINTKPTAKPNTGNIYVDPSVKKFVGTYFADGSILSGTPNQKINYAKPAGDYENTLTNQLILEGIVFANNTLGGSLGSIGSQELFTSWGKTSDLAEAKKYDLHFIRRYNNNWVDLTECGVGRSEKDVECNPLCTPSERNEERCDRNTQAFVIRPDSRVINLAPPGFVNVKCAEIIDIEVFSY